MSLILSGTEARDARKVACPAKEYSFPGNRTEYMTAIQRCLDILMATALTSSPHSSVQESLVMPQDRETHGIPAQGTPPAVQGLHLFLFCNITPLCKIYFHWSWNFILQIWSQEHGSHWQVLRTLIQWDKLSQES